MGQRGEGLSRRDQARCRYQSLISRPDLPHLLGGNGMFIDLAAHERTHPGTSLAAWRPASAYHEPSAFFRYGSDLKLVGAATGLPRPDGAGLWMQDGHAVPYFAEYNTGSERLDLLTGIVDVRPAVHRRPLLGLAGPVHAAPQCYASSTGTTGCPPPTGGGFQRSSPPPPLTTSSTPARLPPRTYGRSSATPAHDSDSSACPTPTPSTTPNGVLPRPDRGPMRRTPTLAAPHQAARHDAPAHGAERRTPCAYTSTTA